MILAAAASAGAPAIGGKQIRESTSPVRDMMKRAVLSFVFLFAASLAALPAAAQDWANEFSDAVPQRFRNEMAKKGFKL